MSTLGKQLMEFIKKHKHNLTDVGFDEDTAWWEWEDGAEAKINEFLREPIDAFETENGRLRKKVDEQATLLSELARGGTHVGRGPENRSLRSMGY